MNAGCERAEAPGFRLMLGDDGTCHRPISRLAMPTTREVIDLKLVSPMWIDTEESQAYRLALCAERLFDDFRS